MLICSNYNLVLVEKQMKLAFISKVMFVKFMQLEMYWNGNRDFIITTVIKLLFCICLKLNI